MKIYDDVLRFLPRSPARPVAAAAEAAAGAPEPAVEPRPDAPPPGGLDMTRSETWKRKNFKLEIAFRYCVAFIDLPVPIRVRRLTQPKLSAALRVYMRVVGCAPSTADDTKDLLSEFWTYVKTEYGFPATTGCFARTRTDSGPIQLRNEHYMVSRACRARATGPDLDELKKIATT